jgi:hypothetical protein
MTYELEVYNLRIIIQDTEICVTEKRNVCILLHYFCLKLYIGPLLLIVLAGYNFGFRTLLRH